MQADSGRYRVTKKPGDMFVFKVPSLRNVAMTGPYFSDGSIVTLEKAVHLMGRHQLGRDLSEADVASNIQLPRCTHRYDPGDVYSVAAVARAVARYWKQPGLERPRSEPLRASDLVRFD
jgi:cytochrome c peroxidase